MESIILRDVVIEKTTFEKLRVFVDDNNNITIIILFFTEDDNNKNDDVILSKRG